MREGIHPKYYQAKVVCNCGNEFVTGSTKEDIHVEICSKCHSFYTGQQKATQARGRLDEVSGLCNKLKAGGNHTLVFAFYILCHMRDDVHSAGSVYLAARM